MSGFRSHKSMQSQSILLIMHKRCSSAGHVGRWLSAHGYRLDIRYPRFGDPLPETMSDHAGAVVFGGPMSVNDADDYIAQEIDWVGVPLAEGRPLLGICLGAQMIAKFLGAPVRAHPQSLTEIGYHPIAPVSSNAANWPTSVYQWHCEGFDLPHGAEALARGEVFENQAFQYDSAVGLQFHPEMTLAMINRWTTHSLHRFSGPCVQPRSAQIGAHLWHGPTKDKWLAGFLASWVEIDRSAG